jgi:hypothetical protein
MPEVLYAAGNRGGGKMEGRDRDFAYVTLSKRPLAFDDRVVVDSNLEAWDISIPYQRSREVAGGIS